jgi:hypothetical protein
MLPLTTTCVDGKPMTKFGVPLGLLAGLALLDCTPGVRESSAYAFRLTRGRPMISEGCTVLPSSAEFVSTSGGASVTVTV